MMTSRERTITKDPDGDPHQVLPLSRPRGRFDGFGPSASAGPPPWNPYRLAFDLVSGVASAEPDGATT